MRERDEMAAVVTRPSPLGFAETHLVRRAVTAR